MIGAEPPTGANFAGDRNVRIKDDLADRKGDGDGPLKSRQLLNGLLSSSPPLSSTGHPLRPDVLPTAQCSSSAASTSAASTSTMPSAPINVGSFTAGTSSGTPGSSAAASATNRDVLSYAESQVEIRELRHQLGNARNIISEQAIRINRLEEENSRLRHYMDELTRYQDMAKRLKIDEVRAVAAPKPQPILPDNQLKLMGGVSGIPGGIPPERRAGSSFTGADYSSGSEISSEAVEVGKRTREMMEEGTGPRSDVGADKQGASAGPKKYRKSCDFCTTTKMRCNGAKPTCENCAKRSILCNYSERKRPGPKIASTSHLDMGLRASDVADKAADYRRRGRMYNDRGSSSSSSSSAAFVKPQPGIGAGGLYESVGINLADQVDAAATLMAMPKLGMSSEVAVPPTMGSRHAEDLALFSRLGYPNFSRRPER